MKKVNNKNFRRQKNGQNRGSTANAVEIMGLYRPVILHKNEVMPDTITKIFSYTTDTLYVTSASAFTCYRFRLNNPYDPDPTLLSSGCAGWTQINAFYAYWKVLSVEVDWSVIGNQTVPVFAGSFAAPDDQVSSIGSVQDALDALENNYSTGSFLLPQYASMPVPIKFLINCAELSGDRRNYIADSDYAGTGSTSPNKMLFIHFILVDSLKNNLNEGVGQSLTLRFKTKFYQRKQLYD